MRGVPEVVCPAHLGKRGRVVTAAGPASASNLDAITYTISNLPTDGQVQVYYTSASPRDTAAS